MRAVGEKIRRLSEMSLPELYERAGQKWRIFRERWKLAHDGIERRESAWWRRWGANRVSDKGLAEALQNGRNPEAASLLPAYFAARPSPAFFFSSEERAEIARVYAEMFPGRVAQLRAEADAVCDHRFRIFGYPEVACGDRIPWRRDFVHGIESGLEHRSRVPYLEFKKVGDSKIVWEPNRHQHFVTLGQAYALTGEERYAEECLEEWEHWRQENPYLRGINWSSSLEAGMRAWSWIWAWHLILGSRALSGPRLAGLTSAVADHAGFIAANLSTYFSPNTHLLGEGFALFVIGLLLPELRGAETWLRTGRSILLEQIQKQVREDGSHIEQSSYYHRYATDFFLCAALLADRNGVSFPDGYLRRLERMIEFMLQTAWPSGLHPMTGDADGGRVLALTPHHPTDHRSTLSTAAVFFRRGDFREAAGRLHEETVWLMGGGAAAGFAELEPSPPPQALAISPEAGIVTMRSGAGERRRMLTFDAGPQGAGLCAHGHADALSILCAADGTDWLVDPGTFAYTSSHLWRDFFRSTRAHNTVVVDGLDQAQPVDFFKWRGIPEVHLERGTSLPLLDFAVGSHNGYTRLRQAVLHRRTIVFVKPDYWIVQDEFSGCGEHCLEFCFHFSAGVNLEPSEGQWVAKKGQTRFLVVPPGKGIDVSVAEGCAFPIQGWYSENYGSRVPAPVLVGSTRASVPATYCWLLCPGLEGGVRVRNLDATGPGLAVETSGGTDFVATHNRQAKRPRQELASDAELCFIRRNKLGEITRMVLVKGSRAETCGQALVRGKAVFEELEISREGRRVEIWSRPEQRFWTYAPGIVEVRQNGKMKPFTRSGDGIELRGES